MLLAGAVHAALLFLLPWDYAIDDTYIHLQFARNLANGDGLTFQAGEPPVYACSSPLWVFILSPPFLAGIGGAVCARLFSSLAAGISSVLAWLLASRLAAASRGRTVAAAAMLLCMADPWMVRWGASGMESTAAAALVAAWALAVVSGRTPPAVTGLIAGVAFLARPELAFLGPLGLVRGRFRKTGASARMLAPWFVITAGWAAFAQLYFGRPLPTAVTAKASTLPISGYLATELPKLFEAVAVSCAPLLALAALVFLTAGRREGAMRRCRPSPDILSVMPAFLLALLLVSGGAPVTTRYLVPALPALFAGLASISAGFQGRPRRLPEAALTATLCVQLGCGILLVRPHMAGVASNMETYREVAAGLDSLTPPGSLIAVQEIGVFGYEGHRRLLDLGGLVTPGAGTDFPGLDRDATASIRYLRSRGATHILDPHGVVKPLMGLSDRLGVDFVPLASWVFPGGTSLSGAATYTRVLYRLDW